MKQRTIAIIFVISLMLPLGIGLAHAFHQHENQQCQAKNESHIHAEKSDCGYLHYFSQSLGDWPIRTDQVLSLEELDAVSFTADQAVTIIFPIADPERGPPIIMTFKV